MRWSASLALLAFFSALIVGTDFALAPYPNVKLMDVVVFVVAFVFGPRLGAGVAVISETAWSFVSPWGQAGAIAPFLVAGEMLFVVAGWGASRVWKGGVAGRPMYMGALMLICALAWDLETNAATALIAYWPDLTMEKLGVTMLFGLPFAIVHEAVDFVFGASIAPVAVGMIPRLKLRW